MDYSIKIDEFEGPFDLLLHLIKEDNIDIYNISIDRITKQYLDYINKMEELNINVAASYLIMAAELMEIKSSSLLPNKKIEENEEEEEISKENLINKLVEYKKYKEISASFKELEKLRENFYVKSPEKVSEYLEDEKLQSNESIDDLMQAFYSYLDRKNKDKPLITKVTNKEYSIQDRKKSIRKILDEVNKIEFSELILEYNKSYMVTTFLSILQMSKDNEIIITQENNFANIYIEKR